MKDKGVKGEEIAVRYLKDMGYRIVERNFSTPFGEIDIISISPEGFLCFTEVKSETNPLFGVYKMDNRKRERMEKVSSFYIMKTGMKRQVRFDFIWVNLEKGEVIKFIKGEAE